MIENTFIKTIFIILIYQSMTIFNFTSNSDISNWNIVDDVVMGGRSDGSFRINKDGHGEFLGKVSLDNNGGFSSLHYDFDTTIVSSYSKFVLRIKGDGKQYQFRVKDNYRNFYSYISSFSTNKNWQLIEINLSEMYPGFRGRKLEMSKFSSSVIEEIAFLIGNKRNESFKIEIDKIYLE